VRKCEWGVEEELFLCGYGRERFMPRSAAGYGHLHYLMPAGKLSVSEAMRDLTAVVAILRPLAGHGAARAALPLRRPSPRFYYAEGCHASCFFGGEITRHGAP
jgi:hypothetical protein